MKNLKTILIFAFLVILLVACTDLTINTNRADENINDQPEATNQDYDFEEDEDWDIEEDWEEGFYDESEDVLNWDFYTLELGRTDPDIQSVKTYTFYLPKDVEFEVMGVDAPSTIIEFKKDNKVIFSWYNRDYAMDEDTFDLMYPECNNYSFVGSHTNVLYFDDENYDEEGNVIYEDDLYVFEDSLKINGQLVFE